MDIQPIEKLALVDFLRALPPTPGSFLQGPWWYKLVENSRDTVHYLGLYAQGSLVGVATTVCRKVHKGFTYTYVPRGPLVTSRVYVAPALAALRDYWRGPAFCLRVEPVVAGDFPVGQGQLFTERADFPKSFREVAEVQPCATSVLDLTQTEEELIGVMHQKARYNIRLSERKAGLTFRWGGVQDFEAFWGLLQGTADRGKFRTHAFNHYHELLKACQAKSFGPGEDFGLRLGVVEYQGEMLAVCLEIASVGVVTYLHGASSRAHPELMAPYLLHWRAIQAARAAGYRAYDWWGVRTERSGTAKWEGFTRFKRRFSGQQLEYFGTFDYPYRLGTYYGYLASHLVDTALWHAKDWVRRRFERD